MKMSRRIFSVLLCCAMLLPMVTMAAYAKGEFVIRGSQTTAHAGDQVTVDIILENNPGISALNLYYIYDKANLTLKQVENQVSAFTMTNDLTTVWDAASNYTQDGVLATLTFEVAENAPIGDYEIEIYFLSAANEEFEEVFATTVSGTITVAKQGCTLEGKITSYGSATDEVTLQMFKAGSTSVYRSVNLKGNSVSYSVADVAYGTYTLKVSKNNHITRTYTLCVDSAEAELDMKICLVGDVTGDGKINVADTGKVYAHVKGSAELADYAFACADVSGDGKINVADTGRIYAHVKGTKKLF